MGLAVELGAVRERVKKMRDVFVVKSYAEINMFVEHLRVFCAIVRFS